MLHVLFESRLREIIFPDGTSAQVPWEITAQADPGAEVDTVTRWARKTGLLARDAELLPVVPVTPVAA